MNSDVARCPRWTIHSIVRQVNLCAKCVFRGVPSGPHNRASPALRRLFAHPLSCSQYWKAFPYSTHNLSVLSFHVTGSALLPESFSLEAWGLGAQLLPLASPLEK